VNATWPQFSSTRFAQMGAAGHVSDNPEGLACFSSRGPTDDGRIKPEVVAPGTNVLSTRSSQVGDDPLWGDLTLGHRLRGLYCWSGGTSMSTPLVAGLAACVREHLVTQRNHFQDGVKPSGALIKAFIVNGAQPINGQFSGEVPSGPNSASGFGRVNAANTINPGQLGRAAFDDEAGNAVETGQMRTFPMEVANVNEPLKVTLCWTDRESTNAGGLQNRLYLQLVDPNGGVINGDVTPFRR
jgi:subtilisin family serine protease